MRCAGTGIRRNVILGCPDDTFPFCDEFEERGPTIKASDVDTSVIIADAIVRVKSSEWEE